MQNDVNVDILRKALDLSLTIHLQSRSEDRLFSSGETGGSHSPRAGGSLAATQGGLRSRTAKQAALVHGNAGPAEIKRVRK